MCNKSSSCKTKCSSFACSSKSSNRCSSSDPFQPIDGTITPFSNTNNLPQGSVKITTKKNSNDKVNIYSFNFPSDIYDSSIGFQAIIMKALETGFKNFFGETFTVGPLPTLGKPITYTFSPNDILASFANRNDYFVFNGSGSSRQVTFIRNGTGNTPDIIYFSGINPVSPIFISGGISYTVLHPSDTDFTITDSNGNILDKTGTVVSYKGSNLPINTSHPDGTITYRNDPYTEVGVTILPGVLPSNPNDIIVADGVKGLFYQENMITSPQNIIDYIILHNPTLTPGINLSVDKVIKAIFSMARSAVQNSLNIPNQDYFSTRNGYGGFASIGGCLSLEIRVNR